MIRYRSTPEHVMPSEGELVRLEHGAEAVALEDALFHLRLDAGTQDQYVQQLVRAVQDQLEPPNGWLGRALTTAEYRLTLPRFGERITLPAPPVQSVDAIEYRDRNGDTQTVDPDDYRLIDTDPAVVTIRNDKSWPDTLDDAPDAVTITFTAGYGDHAEDVPTVIRQWMLMQVSQMFDIRQPVIVGTIATATPFVRDMLESWRVRI